MVAHPSDRLVRRVQAVADRLRKPVPPNPRICRRRARQAALLQPHPDADESTAQAKPDPGDSVRSPVAGMP
jgi:hypothetical protein